VDRIVELLKVLHGKCGGRKSMETEKVIESTSSELSERALSPWPIGTETISDEEWEIHLKLNECRNG